MGATITEIEFVMERLNNRPRKCLGFKSPNLEDPAREVFSLIHPRLDLVVESKVKNIKHFIVNMTVCG